MLLHRIDTNDALKISELKTIFLQHASMMPPAKCCFYHHQMHSAYNEPFLSVDLKQKRSQQKKKSSNSQVIIFLQHYIAKNFF